MKKIDKSLKDHGDGKYHIVFTPSYEKKEFYKEKKEEISSILKKICKSTDLNVLTTEFSCNHIHLLVGIPKGSNISSFIGSLKKKSSLMIRNNWLKGDKEEQSFWAKGYYVNKTENKEMISKYIKMQLQEEHCNN